MHLNYRLPFSLYHAFRRADVRMARHEWRHLHVEPARRFRDADEERHDIGGCVASDRYARRHNLFDDFTD